MSGKRKHTQVVNDKDVSIELALLRQAKEFAEKRLEEVKAEAEKRIAEIKAEADKRVAEADKRATEQVAAADKRADKAHDRLVDFSKFALNLANKTVAESTPRLETTSNILHRHHRNTITYGCAGQVIQQQSKATFSFIEGTKRDIDEEIEHPFHKYIKRGVNVENITDFKSFADTNQVSKKCIDACNTVWNNEKDNYDKVSISPVKRRRCRR